MKRQLLKVTVRSGTEVIGSLTPKQFMDWMNGPENAFLGQLIDQFNQWKESIGEPERVELALVR